MITFHPATIVALFCVPALAAGQPRSMTVVFDGQEYVHRWSKNGQNEFTPEGQADLAKWQEMVTISVHDKVKNGDELAGLANGVLGNYQKSGKILRTDSKPRTRDRQAEHLIVAILGAPGVIEAAFARVLLVEGTGVTAVYSRRAYGQDAAAVVGKWLQENGASREAALMTWDKIPALSAVRALPQSK